jgi:hypothetical protein
MQMFRVCNFTVLFDPVVYSLEPQQTIHEERVAAIFQVAPPTRLTLHEYSSLCTLHFLNELEDLITTATRKYQAPDFSPLFSLSDFSLCFFEKCVFTRLI